MTTKRYCYVCERITVWELDKAVGHSRCSECGSIYCGGLEESIRKLTIRIEELDKEKQKLCIDRGILKKKLKEVRQ